MKYLCEEFNIRTIHLLELELSDPWSPDRLCKISTDKLVNVIDEYNKNDRENDKMYLRNVLLLIIS